MLWKVLICTPPFNGLTQKGDAEMKDLQKRRAPDRNQVGNCIFSPAEMKWKSKV